MKFIAEGSGYVPDSNPSSFHAETCGLLSILEWIHQSSSTTYYTQKICILIDNQSLVTRMKAHATGHLAKMNDTLLASWNITQRRAVLIEQIVSEITIKWLKGHQDSKQGSPLDFEATLNIVVEKLANTVHNRNHEMKMVYGAQQEDMQGLRRRRQ